MSTREMVTEEIKIETAFSHMILIETDGNGMVKLSEVERLVKELRDYYEPKIRPVVCVEEVVSAGNSLNKCERRFD